MVADKDLRLQLYALAPAPSRDYYGLTITGSEVILNIWNISHGPHMYPKRQKALLEDLQDETLIQNEIRTFFGPHVLAFCKSLANNDKNLYNLPTKIFLRILKLLASRDVLALSQTSKIFFELCNTDAVWKLIFRKKIRRPIDREDCKAAGDVGWRKLLMKKLTVRNRILKSASTTGSKVKNNTKVVPTKQHNVDIIRNVKQHNYSNYLKNSISVTELSGKDNKTNVSKKGILKNGLNQTNSTYQEIRNVRSANVKSVHISETAIKNHLNGTTSGVNFRSKTLPKIMTKK
ncbi:f-box domain [Holotrichia oblita]|uniref:F-box domain n=1 Tax=Holotrichia oblita TaxID=644536 RepID=A0ACB9TSX4_HOLOL|nr:f-box domain [Holotrichia oblita]